MGTTRRTAAPLRSHRDGQRPQQLRDFAKVFNRGGAHRVRYLRSQQPGRRRCAAVRYDAGRFLAGESFQRIQWARKNLHVGSNKEERVRLSRINKKAKGEYSALDAI